MKKVLAYVLAIIGLMSSLSGCRPAEEHIGDEVKSSGNDTFEQEGVALELYKGLVYRSNGNMVFSPYSILDALSLLYNASNGEVRKEFEEVLGINDVQGSIYKGYDRDALDGLHVANKIFCNEDISGKLNVSVFDDTDIELIKMDDGAVQKINNYIYENTDNKIKDVISSVSTDTCLIAVNALYFKKNFNFNDADIFWEDGGVYSGFGGDVDLAQIKEANTDIDVLKLDYLNQDGSKSNYSLYIICNAEHETTMSVDSFMESLSEQEFKELLNFEGYNGLSGYADADFIVPDFEIEGKTSVKNALKSLGFSAIFQEGTDGLKNLGEAYVDDVIHASWIKTDKDGTEAAAATAVTESYAAINIKDRTKHIRAENTFVFVVKDNVTNAIMFMGRIADTSAFE